MELIITPFESVGIVKFGESPETVRSVLKSPCKSFMKSSSSEMPTDAFDDIGVHVYYSQNKCEAVECFSPASLTFQGKILIGQPYKEIEKWLLSIDKNVVHGDSGIQSRSFGIGLYAPDFCETENPDATIEAVIVVDKEYFNKQDAILAAVMAEMSVDNPS